MGKQKAGGERPACACCAKTCGMTLQAPQLCLAREALQSYQKQ